MVEETADPAPDGWALVEARAAGVCGTELHFVDGMIPPPAYPFQLGHESAGVVIDAPEGNAVRAGDRVAVYNFVGCGRCQPCRTGRESLCVDPVGQLGFSLPGGFADIVRAPAENLIPLADEAVVLEGGKGYDTLPDRVRELTAGAGADHYVELVGTEETFLAGIRTLG